MEYALALTWLPEKVAQNQSDLWRAHDFYLQEFTICNNYIFIVL